VRKPVPLLGLLAVVAAAACGHGDGGAKIEVSALRTLVLQPADVPRLDQLDVGRITRFDAPSGPRSDPARFGRLEGWKADYKAPAGAAATGPLVVHSQVDLFESGDGARRDLDLYRDEFRAAHDESPRSVTLLDANVGDDATGIAIQRAGRPALRIFTVAWRHDRVTASVTVNGFAGLTRRDVLSLARRQEGRIEAAAS
jgi:hypothetical protein